MNYTNLNCKRRRSARIQSRSIDMIPEALYQNIFSYLLEDNFQDIFEKHYSLQFINKAFQRSFIHYLKTNPISLYITSRSDLVEFTLQIIKFLKRYDISVYDMTVYFRYCSIVDPPSIIMEAMYGINLTSLRKFELDSDEEDFDMKILEGCKELTHFTLHKIYANGRDEEEEYPLSAEKLNTFLSFNKRTLEYLEYEMDNVETYNEIFPKDLSWPNLKKITLSDIRWISASLTIESSTLQHLVLHTLKSTDRNGEMVIRCPNLKVLLINVNDPLEIEFTYRSCKPYDNHERYTNTCHPSELRKIGVVVDVSSDCDIGICTSWYC